MPGEESNFRERVQGNQTKASTVRAKLGKQTAMKEQLSVVFEILGKIQADNSKWRAPSAAWSHTHL